MPTLEEHKKKYEKSKELLNKELDIKTCTNYDWIVTVAFYSAMHLVEAQLAKNGIHNRTHTDRGVMVNRYADFRNIKTRYKSLHDRSIVARYGSACINKKKAEQALQYLSDIENEINI